MPPQLPAPQEAIRERQHRLDAALGELARFGYEVRDVESYYREFLSLVAREVAADGGRTFRRDETGGVKLVAQYGPESDRWTNRGFVQLEDIGGENLESNAEAGISSCHWDGRCVAVRVRTDETQFALVVFEFVRNIDADAKAGVERFLTAAAHLASYFEIHLRQQHLKTRLEDREGLLRLWQEVIRINDSEEAAWRFVNEARRLLGCDRLAFVLARGHQSRVWQVSDLPRPDPNSDYVRHVEDLTSALPDGGGEYWIGGEAEELPASPMKLLLEMHRRISGATVVAVLATDISPDYQVGRRPVLLLEYFSNAIDRGTVSRVAQLRADLLMLAATLAERSDRRSLKIRALSRLTSMGLSRSVALLLTSVAILGGLLFPVPFRVVARGELVPAARREIFAPADGIVTMLAVGHDQNVSAGELLVVLESAELEAERSRIQGLLSTVEEELTAAELARVGEVPGLDRRDPRGDRPAALAEELRIRRESLQQQLELLNRQLEGMVLRSPIQGTVITFALANRLENRPVRRGQSLLQVADLTGDWELQLRVPEQDAGYVLDASQSDTELVHVDFLVTNDPARTYETSLASIARVTKPDADAGSVVEASASVAKSLIEKPRPGATVIAKIDCGKRSLGFVWFHEIFHAARTQLFF